MKDQVVPNLLDGTTHIEGKGKEGNFYNALQSHLETKYPEFLPYLTSGELVILDESEINYKWESRRDRAMKVQEWTDVIDKIPEEVLYRYYDRVRTEYTIKMNKLKAAKRNMHHTS